MSDPSVYNFLKIEFRFNLFDLSSLVRVRRFPLLPDFSFDNSTSSFLGLFDEVFSGQIALFDLMT